jgi:Probable lipoprotein LpqN
MIQITPNYRFLGGMVAGLIGVAVFTGARASADPLVPAPPPAPVAPGVAAPAPQNVATGPINGNRFIASPPSANPIAPPNTTTAPGAPGPAAAAPVPPSAAPASSGTIREYLQSKGVKLEAQKPQGLKALDITLPVPTRWTQVPDPNVPDAFAVIADRQGSSVYTSNAQVVVYKLVGNFDPREAITHGYVDSQKLLAWQPTNASMADFDGFPSSVVEGTYRDGDMLLNTSRRNVIATSGHDKYLVSLAVTTDRAVAVADAPATDAIINGFRVTAPGATAPVPSQAPGNAPVAVTGQTPGTAPLGAPGQTAGAAPVALPGQTAGAAPVALPGQTAGAATLGLPGQAAAQMPSARPTPNLLTLVPGLPPLPNFSFLQQR